jgi:CspA family cold shock protein
MSLSTIVASVVKGYRTLDEGQQVEFEVAQGDKGPQAQDVVPSR